MKAINPANYPNIPWRWRVFGPDGFIGHFEATFPDLMAIQSAVRSSIDADHMIFELL